MCSSQSKPGIKREKFPYGYIIVAACFFTMMIVYGAQYSFGVFLKPVLTEFGWTRAVTAAAYSLNFVFFGLWSILTGRLTDRFGPRLVVTVSGVLVSLCYILMAQVTTLWQVYLVYGLLLSLGVAGIFGPLLSTIARWFITKRGLASGIVSAGIGVGIIVMPPLANFLISSYSWRLSFTVVGFLALAIPVIAQFLKREPGHPGKEPELSIAVHDNKPSLTMQGFSIQQAIRTRQFWLISSIFFVMNLGLQTVMVHIVAYATDQGISANIAVTILSVIGIMSTISKVGIGGAVDRLRSKTVYIIIIILMLIAFLLLQLPAVPVILYIFAVIFAVSYGGYAAAQSPIIAEYFGLKSHGAIFGIALFIGNIGSAIGPYITGLVFDTTSSYYLAFMGCAAIFAIGITLPILLKPIDKNT